MKHVAGFDYCAKIGGTRTMADWQEHMRKALEAGGYRRVENGETFVHDAKGKLLFEIYSNVRLPT